MGKIRKGALMKRRFGLFLCLISVISLLFSSCDLNSLLSPEDEGGGGTPPADNEIISLDDIPDFDGETPYAVINGNVPFFEDEKCDSSYEIYSELDSLGRCGVALACLGPDLMPTEEREEIGHVLPSGWHSVKYDVVPGKNLYNRCHLIGFQLAGENDNEKNLITGTRNMNNEGMLPFENMLADYIKETGNHVLYRVTPIYDGYDLVARGVLMEAKSIEDDEICFCVYVYNCQPGITIDYKTGESRLADDPLSEFVGSGHDESEIIPADAPDCVTEIYAEYVDDEFSGCLIVVGGILGSSKFTLVVDISEGGILLDAAVLSGSINEDTAEAILRELINMDKNGVSSTTPGGDAALVSALKAALLDAFSAFESYTAAEQNGKTFIANTSSKKFHNDTCSYALSMSESNKLVYVGFARDLIEAGYAPCGSCKPAD